MIETISILAGRGKNGEQELFDRFDLHLGQVLSADDLGPAELNGVARDRP